MCDVATWMCSRSFMIDDITRAVEFDSKKGASWRSTRSNTSCRKSVTAENPTEVTT